jgi:NAD+ synthase
MINESTTNKISNWLKDYLEKNKMECFVIGVSGGIDSALSSTLCAMTGKKFKKGKYNAITGSLRLVM